MATFTDCADNLTCATLSGSNGIGVGLVTGTPNKIVVSASNIPNSALANNSININGTTIALGTTGSLAIGDITAVTAGTNLTGGGTSGSLTISLTSSITGGLTNINGLTTLSSSQISGTFSGSLLGTASYATLAGTAATASYVATGSAIATFTNDVRNQFSAGSNIGISSGVISLSSSVSTTALSGTTGVSGALGLFANLTGTNITGSRITGSFTGSAGGLYNLTASGISNFTNDVRTQFSAGTNITINNGVISASGGGGGGSGTINTGSAGYVTYYPSAGTTVDDASGSTGGLYWDNANIRLGVNTTSPAYRLDVAGTGRFTSNVEVTGTVKSTGTIYSPGLILSNSSGFSSIELGAPNGAHIDLKRPETDDYDIRLISDNNIEGGGYLLNAGGAILALSGSGVAVGQYSSAGYKFLVGGTTRLANTVEIGQSGTLSLYDNATQVVVQYPNKQVSFYDSTAASNRMLIDTNGNVGIGTSTPAYKLDVAGTGRFTSNVEITGTLKGLTQLSSSAISASTYIGLPSSTATITVYEEGASLGSSFTGVNFKGLGITAVANGATADVTVAQAGAAQEGVVSTGTQTFAGNKTFSGDVSIQGNTTIGNAAADTITMTAATMSLSTVLNIDSNTVYIDGTNNRTYFGTNTGTYKVGINSGTSSAAITGALQIIGNTSNTEGLSQKDLVTIRNTRGLSRSSIAFEDTDGTKGASIGFGTLGVGSNIPYEGNAYLDLENYATQFSVINSTNELWHIDTGGVMYVSDSVGIGTSAPSYQLELTLNSAAKPTSNTWTISSDRRIKENILPYTKSLETLININPITYDYNGLGGFKKGKGGIGIIAQEVVEILPEAISTYYSKLNSSDEEKTQLYNFDSHPLTYVMINSIKELKKENDDLKKTLNEVLARLSALENK